MVRIRPKKFISAKAAEVLRLTIEVLALLIALVSLIVAVKSFETAQLARDDVHKIERLDLEPKISFTAKLLLDRYGINKNLYGTSSFTVANFGAIDALQMNVKFIDVCFDKEKKEVTSYGRQSKLNVFVGTLEPYEKKTIDLDQNTVNQLAYCHDNPPLDAGVLAWISYKRDPDRRTYITRALYFVSKNGFLSADSGYYQDEEGNSLLDDEYYDVYSDMIIDYSSKFSKFLEEDNWDAIYPLEIQ